MHFFLYESKGDNGTQTKHTDMASVNSALNTTANNDSFSNLSNPNLSISASKAVSGSATLSGSDTVLFGYKVTLRNNGSSAVTIDKVVDTADANLSMVTSSVTIGSTPLSFFASGSSGGNQDWTIPGPFNIAGNGGEVVIAYQMYVPICQVVGIYSFSNIALAYLGSTQITSTPSSVTGVTSEMNCSSSTTSPTFSQTGSSIQLEPIADALNTQNIQSSTASLSGTVDSNGVAGEGVVCEVSTSQNFSTLVSGAGFAASPSTTGAGTSPVSTTCNATGLDPDTKHFWRFKVGSSIFSNILDFSTLPEVSGNPSVATDGVTEVTTTQATLLGTVTSNAQDTYV
jgi:uncharacterized repeat protein (TIGR01451 family)